MLPPVEVNDEFKAKMQALGQKYKQQVFPPDYLDGK